MAFIDELKIYAVAGDGGDGVIRWRHEKGNEYGGPSGGNGGRGGAVFVVAVRDLHLLSRYRVKKEFSAERGEDGKSDSLYGANGEDLNIALPIGSVITNIRTGEKISLLKEGEKIMLLKGGIGGRGNESFKSSTNRSPQESTKGLPGQKEEFFVEILLIADIGLIGLPNAGKTSLLNTLTQAKGKVGDYPFTTLEPSLGEFFGYIIADIPGLIEGASSGKGLGHKFLRHIKRTKILLHLISLENEDPVKVYEIIRKELEQFDSSLLDKKEIVILTKTDLIEDKEYLKKIIEKMRKKVHTIKTISLYDDDLIKELQDFLFKEVKDTSKLDDI